MIKNNFLAERVLTDILSTHTTACIIVVPSSPFVSGNEMGYPVCLWSVNVRVATESAKNNTKWSETRPAKPIWGLWVWVGCRNGAMNDSEPIFA